jgi:hypothetical protein
VSLTVTRRPYRRESERAEEALATVIAASLALEIADRDVKPPTTGKANKRFADDDIFDVFAESDYEDDKTDEAAAAVAGRRKRSRRGDVDNEPNRQSSSPACQTACSTSPVGETNAWSSAACLPIMTPSSLHTRCAEARLWSVAVAGGKYSERATD